MEDKIYDGGELPNTTVTAPKAFAFDYDLGREITGPYSESMKQSIDSIMKEISLQGITLKTQAAYILATSWHESRLTPIKEWGGEDYLKSKPYYPFYGRGYCQLSWKENYLKEGRRLGMNLVDNPDLVLKIDIAANILVNGMIKGAFTGKKLSDYISTNKTDYQQARRIINSTDKMELVASYASKFFKCII